MDAQYDMTHELGRGTFATVMKVMARNTGKWWAIQDHRHAEGPAAADATAITTLRPQERIERVCVCRYFG